MRHTEPRSVRRPLAAALTAGLAGALTVFAAGPASAAPAAPAVPATPVTGTSVAEVTDGLARQLAGAIARPAARSAVARAVAAGPADLASLRLGAAFDAVAADANTRVATAKGLPSDAPSLLRVRLVQPAGTSAAVLTAGGGPLVTAAPDDDTDAAVIAYAPDGSTVALDAHTAPQRPVLVVEVDVAKALPIGLSQINKVLPAKKLPARTSRGPQTTEDGGYPATRIDAIRVGDDEEPWTKGDAEMFALVGGWDLAGKARVDTVQLPYLNDEDVTYHPNQLVVHYNAYKYNLADVVLMEDDGDTNYLVLAQAITTALLTLVEAGEFAPLVNAILAALPDSFWTDDPDFVESWHTLSTESNGRVQGASANGWMEVSPYWVEEL